jgi:uncharacterized membrane protein
MRTKEFLGRLDHERIVQAIKTAEAQTSGEIRVYLQRGFLAEDPLVAAQRNFQKLGMHKTRERNAVLIFVAPRAQKFAVIGDQGVQVKCGDLFWRRLIDAMQTHFKTENFTAAVVQAIEQTGELLAQHFPRRPDDRNELPNAVEGDM